MADDVPFIPPLRDHLVQPGIEVAVAPTEIETVIRNLLKEVLPLVDIDLSKHFVDLGGDSLVATKLMSRLSGAFGIDFPPILAFEAATLQDLVARIDAIQESLRHTHPSICDIGGNGDHGTI